MSDTLASLVAYARRRARGANGPTANADLTDAVNDAVWMIATSRRWSWYRQRGYLTLNGVVAAGTVTLTQGSATATLTEGAWPAWASSGNAKLIGAGLWLRIVSFSGADATLETPWAEPTVSQSATVYRDEYPLPADVMMMGRLLPGTRWGAIPDPLGADEVWTCLNQVQIANRFPAAWGVSKRTLALFPYPTNDQLQAFSYYRAPTPMAADDDVPDWEPNNREVLKRAIDYQTAIMFGATATDDAVREHLKRFNDALGRAVGNDGAPGGLPAILGSRRYRVPLWMRGLGAP